MFRPGCRPHNPQINPLPIPMRILCHPHPLQLNCPNSGPEIRPARQFPVAVVAVMTDRAPGSSSAQWPAVWSSRPSSPISSSCLLVAAAVAAEVVVDAIRLLRIGRMMMAAILPVPMLPVGTPEESPATDEATNHPAAAESRRTAPRVKVVQDDRDHQRQRHRNLQRQQVRDPTATAEFVEKVDHPASADPSLQAGMEELQRVGQQEQQDHAEAIHPSKQLDRNDDNSKHRHHHPNSNHNNTTSNNNRSKDMAELPLMGNPQTSRTGQPSNRRPIIMKVAKNK
mmetsp:Transcript_23067/g.65384  ORF Transcript_23067/g.65384 Transcript_23067/m.65384 type:complete len:283 (-) Transcript_23067:29-877(-)